MNQIIHVIAKSPPAIAIAIGGAGWLVGVHGAGWLIAVGIVLQLAWIIF